MYTVTTLASDPLQVSAPTIVHVQAYTPEGACWDGYGDWQKLAEGLSLMSSELTRNELTFFLVFPWSRVFWSTLGFSNFLDTHVHTGDGTAEGNRRINLTTALNTPYNATKMACA